MEEPTNDDRVGRGQQLVELYHTLSNTADEMVEDVMTDIFADLMHFCRYNGVDIEETVERASWHFHEEVREEGLASREGDNSW